MRLVALLVPALLIPAGCSHDGSLLIVDVSATPALAIDHLDATIAADGRTKTFSVPVADGSLTALFFNVELPPEVTTVAVTLDAGGEEVVSSTSISPGKTVVLPMMFGLGVGDLGDAGTDDAGDGMSAPVCGDGHRDGLEGCDDGNTADGDGCAHDCVVETSQRPTFADVGSNTPASIAVTQNGTTWMRRGGSCSGATMDHLDRVSADGATVVTDAIAMNVKTSCGGDIVSDGNSIVWGGTDGTNLYVQKYNTSTSGVSPVDVLSFAETHNWTAFAAMDAQAGFYFSQASTPGLGTTYVSGSMLATFASTPSSCGRLFVDHTTTPATLLCGSGLSAYRSSLPVNGAGDFSIIDSFGNGMLEPSSSMTDITVDSEGTVYVSILNGGVSSAAGAVQAFNPTFTPAKTKFLDSSQPVRAMAYDASTNDLVVLAGSTLKRISLNR